MDAIREVTMPTVPGNREILALLAPENRPLLRALVEEGPTAVLCPVTVILDITHDCPFACPGCIEREPMSASGRAHLSLQTIQRLLSDAAEAGVRAIELYGGEPTCHPDFPETVSAIVELGLFLRVVTNGAFLGRRTVADSLVFATRNERLCDVRVSWNAATSKTHALLHRSERWFFRIVDACERLAEDGVPISVSFLVEPANAREIFPAAVLAVSMGARYFSIRPKTGDHGADLFRLDAATRSEILHAVRQVSTLAGLRLFVPDWYLRYLRTGELPATEKTYGTCPFAAIRCVVTPPEPGYIWTCTYWRHDSRFGGATLPFPDWLSSKRRLLDIAGPNPAEMCRDVICNKHAAILQLLQWREAYHRYGTLPDPVETDFVPFFFA